METAARTAGISPPYFWVTRSWFWLFSLDIYPVLVAVCIPWSTTAVAIFMAIWFVALLPTIEPKAFLNILKLPAFWLPLGFFALAILGMLWANGPWSTRFHGVDPVAKLLAIPFLFYHFGRSQRGQRVFIAFLFSCVLLMLASWGVLFAPEWRMTHAQIAGVPIKNYIDQSQEFALCIFALIYLISVLLPQRRFTSGVICTVLVFGFCANLMFVVVARTALVYIPALLVLFAAAWIGLIVVVQNFISSLFNSHLFDFNEGWIYVLGVGVAGGMMASRSDLARTVLSAAHCDELADSPTAFS